MNKKDKLYKVLYICIGVLLLLVTTLLVKTARLETNQASIYFSKISQEQPRNFNERYNRLGIQGLVIAICDIIMMTMSFVFGLLALKTKKVRSTNLHRQLILFNSYVGFIALFTYIIFSLLIRHYIGYKYVLLYIVIIFSIISIILEVLSFKSKYHFRAKFVYNVIGEVLTISSFILLLIYDIRSQDVLTANLYLLALSIFRTIMFIIIIVLISICLYIKLNDE